MIQKPINANKLTGFYIVEVFAMNKVLCFGAIFNTERIIKTSRDIFRTLLNICFTKIANGFYRRSHPEVFC